MNIFNGHEDQSPEELANELGISESSIVENAGRKTKDILEEPISKISVLKGVTIKDIDQLTDGNILIYKGKIGTIVNQNFARELTLVKRGEGTETEYFLGDLIKTHKHLGIGVKSIKTGKWIDSPEISPKEGMKIRSGDGNIGKITDIPADMVITIKRDTGKKIRYYQKLPLTYQIYQENSQFKSYEWTKDYDVSLLKKGTTVKIHDILIGTIDKIHKNTIDISFSNGTSESFSIESFQKDIEIDTYIEVNGMEDLSTGDFIKKKGEDKDDVYLIRGFIKNSDKTINLFIHHIYDDNEIDITIDFKTSKTEWIKVNPFQKKYIKFRDEIILNKPHGDDNTVWCSDFTFEDLHKGMKIRSAFREDLGIEGYINHINDKSKIGIKWHNGTLGEYNKEKLDIFKVEINISKEINTIEDLEEGMYVKERATGEICFIKDIIISKEIIRIETLTGVEKGVFYLKKFQEEWITLIKKP